MRKQVSILLIGPPENDFFLKKSDLEHLDESWTITALTDTRNAISYLNKEGDFSKVKMPQLIIIDLNLPGNSGVKLLKFIKKSAKFKSIPVVIISVSRSEQEVMDCYQNRANCVITSAGNFKNNIKLLTTITDFWINIVQLPTTTDK